MSYLHCHNCGWSQDDFWNFRISWKKFFKWRSRPFGYNPLSLVLEDVAEYWKPRYIGFDSNVAKEYGFILNKEGKVHSWRLLRYDVKIHIKRLFTQKWWTEKSFKKDYYNKRAMCPNCSANDFDID